MRRRLNYTGRRRIRQSDVSITITEGEDRTQRFYADLVLSEYGFPEQARVWVEAYDRDSIMRFPFGTVSSPRNEVGPELTSFKGSDSYHFRIKVVDPNKRSRLLGIADSISPVRQNEGDDAKTSLLRVTTRHLEAVPWRIEFSVSDYPLLVINNEIELGKSLARSNRFFQGAVFSSIVERILRKILVEDGYRPNGEPDPEDEWKEAWLEYSGSLQTGSRLAISSDPSDDEIEEWIEASVEAFCSTFNSVRKLKIELGELDT